MALTDGVVLPPYPPAGICAGDDVNEAFSVTLVAVVICGEKVSEFVKSRFLRVAQAAHDEFEVGSVWFAPEDTSFVRKIDDGAAGSVLNACSAVTDAEVESSVRTEGEAVKVVAGVAEPDAPSVAKCFAALGTPIGADAFKEPEVGDIGEPDFTVEREDATGDAIEHRVESVGEDPRGVSFAGAFGIFDEAYDLGFAFEGLPVVGEVLFGVCDAILHAS